MSETPNSTPPNPKPEGEKPSTINKPKVKKGWSNPALRMMGIPRISLPSRNWMIFWTVIGSIGGGIAYDKYEQSQIRKKYMNLVKHLGEEKYETNRLPRKLTIFIAPPPNDFLDESLKYFKKYVKPILNAAAIDYDIYTENRQGDIRSQVAEKIRQLRKSKIENKENVEEIKKDLKIDEESVKQRNELYEPTDVLGLYKILKPIKPHRDDEEDFNVSGGVICIGRGTFKEYITGIHEGLLGPLEKPISNEESTSNEESKLNEESTTSNEESTTLNESNKLDIKSIEEFTSTGESTSSGESTSEINKPENKEESKTNNNNDEDDEFQKHDEEEEESNKSPPVEKPYILPSQYKESNLAPELNFNEKILNDKNVPVLFEQPVYAYPVPNLLGFFNMPHKIYRYFTKRNIAENYGHRTLSIIYNLSREFEYKDQFMAKEEELDWPTKWIEKGKSKGSEWVQELECDERIINRMKVYDETLIKNYPELLKEKKNEINDTENGNGN